VSTESGNFRTALRVKTHKADLASETNFAPADNLTSEAKFN